MNTTNKPYREVWVVSAGNVLKMCHISYEAVDDHNEHVYKIGKCI